MSQEAIESVDIGQANIRSSLTRDKRVVMPNPTIIGLAMMTGAGFLYLLLLFEIVPVHAVDGHSVTMVLAVIGVCSAAYGWLRILAGDRT